MALYPISVVDDTTASATSDEMVSIDAFNDRLRADGQCVFAGGLGAPPSTATVIDNRGGEVVLPAGPSWSRRSISPSPGVAPDR
jgi:hypothetical protein